MRIIENYVVALEQLLDIVILEEQKKTISEIKYDAEGDIIPARAYLRGKDGTLAKHELDGLIAYFRKSKEECVKDKHLFFQFEQATKFMTHFCEFKPIDAYRIIAEAIKRNYEVSITSKSRIVLDYDKVRATKFKTMSSDKALEILSSTDDTYKKFYSNDNLTDEELLQKKELKERFREFTYDYSNYCNLNNVFYLSFVKVFPNITLGNIVEAKRFFKAIDISNELINMLIPFFISVFRDNLDKSAIIFDIEINKSYLNLLVLDEEMKEEIVHQLERHNKKALDRLENEQKILDRMFDASEKEAPKSKYLPETEYRKLKKYVRVFFDTYNVLLRKVPNYSELINCITYLEQMGEDKNNISRLINLAINEILLKTDFISQYSELLELVSYLIKYNIGRNKIDSLIIQYKDLKPKNEDFIEFLKDSLDEIALYDEVLSEDIKFLISEIDISNKEDYEALTALLKECYNSFSQYRYKTDYEYLEALKILGR